MVRFYERGHGLFARGVTDHCLEARLGDLEPVVDAGLDRLAILAMAQGGPIAIKDVTRHPGRLTRLACYSTYAAATKEEPELDEAFTALIRVRWKPAGPRTRTRSSAARGVPRAVAVGRLLAPA